MSVLWLTGVFLAFSISAFDFNTEAERYPHSLGSFAYLGSWNTV